MYMLHAPDFLGYPDAVRLAKDHPDLVKRALRTKKLGNHLMRVVGGREVHPVNVRLGGFYRVPTKDELAALVPELRWALEAAVEGVRLTAGLPFLDFERDYHFVSLKAEGEYPIDQGRIVSSRGWDAPVEGYDALLEERHDEHSTALRSYPKDGGVVHMGPLARYALNHELLGPRAKAAAKEAGLGPVVRNPFRSIVVRAVEVVYAIEEALRIIDAYERPAEPFVEVKPRAGTGSGATEAPRGICYHRYTIDDAGLIREAKIVAPTSVNQRVIEEDLHEYVAPNAHLDDDRLRAVCEQAIRNYDPCISCSTHFLKLTVDRG
jgi:sulfhydrogenase subunit alpha